MLAANTSFQGFPRLSALLARDRFAPRQFTNLGDRLVFSNGMLVLATRRRAPALGLRREHEQPDPPLRDRRLHGVHALAGRDGPLLVGAAAPRWHVKARRQRDRAAATGVVTLVVVCTKFAEGAWLVTVAIPRARGRACSAIRRHYDRLARRLEAGAAAVVAAPPARNTTLLVVEALDEATERACWFARAISADGSARCTCPRAARTRASGRAGSSCDRQPPLEALDRRRLGVTEAMLEQVWRLPRGESDFVTVVVPEPSERESLARAGAAPARARAQAAPPLRAGRRRRRRPRRRGAARRRRSALVGRVLVSGVNAASMRAVNYAQTLGIADVRAVHFAFSGEDAARSGASGSATARACRSRSTRRRTGTSARPLLGYLRELTADAATEVLVLMPELVMRGWRRLLHNQRALYVKRLLLFEPHVILATVPYQLLR